MIATITANPAIDKRLVVAGLKIGATNRAAVERVDIGGKGINVACNLAQLGCEVTATGLLGHGALGLRSSLRALGVVGRFVQVPGEVRTNLKILDPSTRIETEINEIGPAVPSDAIDTLSGIVRVLACECTVMVFSGSLPPGAPEDLYARYIRLARDAGVRTVLDTAGAALVHGIAASPDVVKPNRFEAEQLLGSDIRNERDLAAAARQLLDAGARTAFISVGEGGAVAASADGVWRARPPRIVARNPVGAGDAMVAALAYALDRDLPLVEALRFATALGTAAAASEAPLPVPSYTDRLLSQVTLEGVAPSEIRANFPGLAT